MQRLGLCCIFVEAPIRFRTATVRYVSSLPVKGADPLQYLSEIVQDNANSLVAAITYCADHGIGSFRIFSGLLPISTHPQWGYQLDDLPDAAHIRQVLAQAKEVALHRQIRLTFHPDQFVVLNSPREDVVEKSITDLEMHGMIAELVGADVINIHGGGGYGNKEEALHRFAKNFTRLSPAVQKRLTVENDDKVFTPHDLLPLCHQVGIPLVYDVHHHRCLPDRLSIEEATEQALQTWDREPLFHISSPKEGWKGKKPYLHHDYIDPADLPDCWMQIDPLTIDIEAKAKELAVEQLRDSLVEKGWELKKL